MKYPYLKNECNDGHFDLTEAGELVAKALQWFQRSIAEQPQHRHLAADFKEPVAEWRWDWWAEPLQTVCRREERKLMDQQRALFSDWNRCRKELIEVQVRLG